MSMQFLCTFVIQFLRHLSRLIINNNYKYIDMAREKTAECAERPRYMYLHEGERDAGID